MQTFAIAPATSRSLWVLALLPLLIVPAIAVLGASFAGARGARAELSPEGLRLRGDLYGRLIPASSLLVADARRVDFATSPELLPKRRTVGTALPGYQAGWFRLRTGEKALLYLTDRRRAVYVPTTAGYGVLLSPQDPDDFLSALRAMARHPG